MTAPIRLTLPGPVVTCEVTWEHVRAYLRAGGWTLTGVTSEDASLWSHPDTDEQIIRYEVRDGDPRANDARAGNILVAVLTLARLASVTPGEMLARIADPPVDLWAAVRARLGKDACLRMSAGLDAAHCVTWRRDYGDAISDERQADGESEDECLREVLAWEDAADARDAQVTP